MKRDLLQDLLRLRLTVGYLGEQHSLKWWSSHFFSTSSKGFLTPIFGRTPHVASYYGTKEAATKVHDEFIGIGRGVFHLFRLPESIEIEMHQLVLESSSQAFISTIIANETDCLSLLKDYGVGNGSHAVGPVIQGDMNALQDAQSWKQIAWQYAGAFESQVRVYPYFAERS